jgi:hypothetical protein
LLFDTTRVRQLGVGSHGRKTDRQLRLELSVRRTLVETRARYVTTLRGLARARGVRLPSCDTNNFVSHVRKAKLVSELRELIGPIAQVLEQITSILRAPKSAFNAPSSKTRLGTNEFRRSGFPPVATLDEINPAAACITLDVENEPAPPRDARRGAAAQSVGWQPDR